MNKYLIIFISLVAGLGLSACTPEQALWMHFGHVDGATSTPALYSQAKEIAWCESRFNPSAVSPTNDHGLMQINIIHRANFEAVTGTSWENRYDPFWNARYARWLYDNQGWRPWTCRNVL